MEEATKTKALSEQSISELRAQMMNLSYELKMSSDRYDTAQHSIDAMNLELESFKKPKPLEHISVQTDDISLQVDSPKEVQCYTEQIDQLRAELVESNARVDKLNAEVEEANHSLHSASLDAQKYRVSSRNSNNHLLLGRRDLF